jgi:predicted DNA-binding protein
MWPQWAHIERTKIHMKMDEEIKFRAPKGMRKDLQRAARRLSRPALKSVTSADVIREAIAEKIKRVMEHVAA